MKWRDWAVGEYSVAMFKRSLWVMFTLESGYAEHVYAPKEFASWLITAQPEHYIKAACLCKLGSEEAK
jgi:hypothetical protein